MRLWGCIKNFILRALLHLTLCIFPLGLFWFLSFYNNKTIIVSIVLCWVLWVFLVNYQIWVDNRNPEFLANWSEVKMAWGLPNLQLLSEIRAVWWWIVPLTCEIWPNNWVAVSEVIAFPEPKLDLIMKTQDQRCIQWYRLLDEVLWIN